MGQLGISFESSIKLTTSDRQLGRQNLLPRDDSITETTKESYYSQHCVNCNEGTQARSRKLLMTLTPVTLPTLLCLLR
jgi:hypothetical protein